MSHNEPDLRAVPRLGFAPGLDVVSSSVPSWQLRVWWETWFGEDAKATKSVRVPFVGDGMMWWLRVADVAAPAFEALAFIFDLHHYLFRESTGGTWNVRKIANSEQWSLHSYGIALDINPGANPYGAPLRYDIPDECIADVLALRTANGNQVFSWGGSWNTPDAMHFQINTSPASLASGIIGLPEVSMGVDFVTRGDENDAVGYWQRVLRQTIAPAPLSVDNKYGPSTEDAVAQVTGLGGNRIDDRRAYIIHREWIKTLIGNAAGGVLLPHNHARGSLAVDSLDNKTIKGRTGPAKEITDDEDDS